MVALFIPVEMGQKIEDAASAIKGQHQQADKMHVTLAYLPESPSPAEHRILASVTANFAKQWQPFQATIGGIGRFSKIEDDGTNAVYAPFDAPELPMLREGLVTHLERVNYKVSKNHGFTPHVTIAYIPKGAPTPGTTIPPMQYVVDELVVSIGDAQYPCPLGGINVDAAQMVESLHAYLADTLGDKFEHLQTVLSPALRKMYALLKMEKSRPAPGRLQQLAMECFPLSAESVSVLVEVAHSSSTSGNWHHKGVEEEEGKTDALQQDQSSAGVDKAVGRSASNAEPGQ